MVLASDRPSQQPGGKPHNGFDSVAVAKGRHGEKICRRLHHLPKVQKYAEHEHPLEKAEHCPAEAVKPPEGKRMCNGCLQKWATALTDR